MANQKRFDEFYSNGKIELGRSGNFVSVKNKYTAEEIKNRNKIIASHIEEAKDEINELVNAIVEKIHRCDPLFLLLSATDVAMSSLIHVVSEIQIDQDSITNMRLIEYIQSILVAQPYTMYLLRVHRMRDRIRFTLLLRRQVMTDIPLHMSFIPKQWIS